MLATVALGPLPQPGNWARRLELLGMDVITTGAAVVQGFRGIAMLVAQTVTGQRDTAVVSITPTPTAIAVTAGNNQQVVQRLTFPAPVRVRVTAGDGLPVAGEIVAFTVTAGQGTVSAARDTTDATGFAEVTWTAGALTGSAALRAEVLSAARGSLAMFASAAG